jgi:cyclohexadienyl dehydratase
VRSIRKNRSITPRKAYWLQRDTDLKNFVDRWVQKAIDDGSFAKIYAAWFE